MTSYTTLLYILIITTQILVALSQKVVLLSSSQGYYNIRQVNNIVNIYHHFRNNGFTDQDILLSIGQIQPCCEKNHMYGTLSFYDGDYTNIFKDIQVDYYQSEMALQLVANFLMGYYPKYRLNKRKLLFQQDQPYFIYVTGHGGDTYFKIRQREALITEQFASIFQTLNIKKIVKKTALFSDSCSAITPFETVTADNFIALASSSFNQKSFSHGYDPILNQPKTDDFSFQFNQILSQKVTVKGISSFENWTFKQLQKYMSVERLKSHSKLISNGINKNEKVSPFLKKRQSEPILKKLNKNLNLNDFFD